MVGVASKGEEDEKKKNSKIRSLQIKKNVLM
jgi:hypothetical protein